MATPPDDLFEQVLPLLGRRADDPAVVAFHAARGLKPPPVVTKTDMLYDVRDKQAGVVLNYQAEVRRAGFYPPRKEGGKYVAYLSSIRVPPVVRRADRRRVQRLAARGRRQGAGPAARARHVGHADVPRIRRAAR
ncbi:hypothetical protein [Nannocystis pusilla]|uniref:hypothetical protein n=1 Tax=Nannocystis pusilla TaxID=889268 RepID=UPI003DA2ABF9